MKRCGIFTVVVLASIAVAGIGAASAAAVPPICDPGEEGCGGGGGTHTFTRTLTVTQPSPGRVTGDSIDCGGGNTDCTRSETYTQTCDEFGICDEPDYASATLTASQGPGGYAPVWTGCDSEPASGTCGVTIDEDVTVSLAWRDVTPPNVTFNPPAKAGPATLMTAGASDNSGPVNTMQFLVDGVFAASDGSAPYQFDFPEQLHPHGSSHTVTARAVDAAGNQSSAGGTVTVDKQVSLELGSSPAQGGFTNAASAPLSFTTDSDVPAAGRRCRLDGGAFTQCASPFEPALPEGSRTYEVQATDDVGNVATASRSFTVDRTAPSASFTGGPDEGAIVGTATVTFEFSGGDAAPTTQACSLDGAGFGGCTSQGSHTLTDLASGDHVLAVRITDAAGNAGTIERHFAVQRSAGGVGGGGGPEPPPSTDSKAPTLTANAPKKPLKKGSLVLILASDEAATVTVEPKGSKTTIAELEPGQEEKVKAKLGKSTLRSLTRSLREKGRAKLKVALNASDAAGNATEKTMKVKLLG
jgi:hypothetical protein